MLDVIRAQDDPSSRGGVRQRGAELAHGVGVDAAGGPDAGFRPGKGASVEELPEQPGRSESFLVNAGRAEDEGAVGGCPGRGTFQCGAFPAAHRAFQENDL
nr:hypothetical protein [Streptomyces palmae]